MTRNERLAATANLNVGQPQSRGADVVELSAAKPAAAGPDILRRAGQFSDSFDRITAGEINPFSIVIDEPLGPVEAMIGGRRTIMFGTNSYLGLNFHPDCIRAAGEALARYGTGSDRKSVV